MKGREGLRLISQGLTTGVTFLCISIMPNSPRYFQNTWPIKFWKQLHKITLHYIDQEVKVQRIMETPRSKSELRVQHCSNCLQLCWKRGRCGDEGGNGGLSWKLRLINTKIDLDQSRSIWSLAWSWYLKMIGWLLLSGGDSLPLCFSRAPSIIFITQWTFLQSFLNKWKTFCLPPLLHRSHRTSMPLWLDLGWYRRMGDKAIRGVPAALLVWDKRHGRDARSALVGCICTPRAELTSGLSHPGSTVLFTHLSDPWTYLCHWFNWARPLLPTPTSVFLK